MDENLLIALISACGLIVAALVGYYGVSRTNRQAKRANDADAEVEARRAAEDRRIEQEKLIDSSMATLLEEYRQDRQDTRNRLHAVEEELRKVRAQMHDLEEVNREALRTNSRLRARVNGLIGYVGHLRAYCLQHNVVPPDPPLDVSLHLEEG